MNESIGSRVAKYRKEKGMTQEELANIMGVSSQAVSKWENNASCPDISLLPQLARELGITTDELLTGKSNEVWVAPEQERKRFEDLIMRIKVNSADGDKISVNLPMTMVRVMIEIGMDASGSVCGLDAIKGVDFSKIAQLAEKGMVGKFVEVESAEGDTVEIVVE